MVINIRVGSCSFCERSDIPVWDFDPEYGDCICANCLRQATELVEHFMPANSYKVRDTNGKLWEWKQEGEKWFLRRTE